MTDIPQFLNNLMQNSIFKQSEEAEKLEENQIQNKLDKKTEHSAMKPGILAPRSKKNNTQGKYQISFESRFLDAHIQAFTCVFQKYWRIQHKKQFRQEFKFISNYLLQGENKNCCEWMEKQVDRVDKISEEDKLQLIQDWKKQEYLCKFFKVITSKLSSEIKTEILCISILIWEIYLKVSDLYVGDFQKMKRMNTLLRSNIHKVQWMNQIQSEVQSEQQREVLQEALLQFLCSYCDTMFLVVEGYFDNPFSGIKQSSESIICSNLDWESDDDNDEALMGLPRKMQKLS